MTQIATKTAAGLMGPGHVEKLEAADGTQAAIAAGATKATPVDADQIAILDSADSGKLKRLTWANVKATLKTYFDTLYATAAQGAKADSAVQPARSISTGDGLTGGGDLSANRTLAVDKASAANIRAGAANKVITADGIGLACDIVTLTDASTVAVDWATFETAKVVLTADRIIGNPTNVQVGTTRYLFIQGSSATARTPTFGSNFKGDLPTGTVTSTSWLLIGMTAYSATHIVVTSCKAL